MIKIVFIALIGIFASLLLKKYDSQYSFLVVIVTGVIIISVLYVDISNVVQVFNTFKSGYGVSDEHIKLLLKVLGISYITQFGASVADECGEKFVAKKIEFAGRIFIISLSVPILLNLMNTIINLI